MQTPQPFKHLSNFAHCRMRITFLSPLWLLHIYFSCVSPFHCNRREWYFNGSNAVALFLPLLFDQRASENECRPEMSSILQSIPVHPLEYHLPPLLSFFVIRFSYGCSNSFALHARLCSFSLWEPISPVPFVCVSVLSFCLCPLCLRASTCSKQLQLATRIINFA